MAFQENREQREDVFQGSHMTKFIFQRDHSCCIESRYKEQPQETSLDSPHSHCHVRWGIWMRAVGRELWRCREVEKFRMCFGEKKTIQSIAI